MNSQTNILFLFTDDQRFDTINAVGNEAISTPHMDRLVSSGVCFTRAHIPGGTSEAICMPSRAMLHTGRSLFRLEGDGESIPPNHATMGEVFGSAGYRTFGTGKWHNGPDSFNRSFAEGDEIFFGGMADHWNVPAFHYDPTGVYGSELPICEDPQSSNHITRRPADHIESGVHSSELIADSLISFLSEVPAAEPFFAYAAFLAPHDPRTMPERFRTMYNPESIVLPPNFMTAHPFDNGELHVRDELLAGFPRTHAEARRHIAEYFAMISHLDFEIGRVLDLLEERNLTKSTLIVLAGDNGLAVGQHGLLGKQSCYEHSVRVPLILSGPGVQNASRDESLFLYDIFPTLCEYAGVEAPESVEGRSFLSLLRGEPESYEERDKLYFAYKDKHRAVKSDRFKLIEYAVDGGHAATQLFDLADDPWEMKNLAETNPAVRDRLRKDLVELSKSTGDRSSSWGRTFWDCVAF